MKRTVYKLDKKYIASAIKINCLCGTIIYKYPNGRIKYCSKKCGYKYRNTTKGMAPSKHTRNLISKAKKGKTFEDLVGKRKAEKWKKNISIEHKGINTWLKGKKLTTEHKEKIKKFMNSDKNPNIGKKYSQEHINKIKVGAKKYYQTHTHSNKGKTFEEIIGVKRAKHVKNIMRKKHIEYLSRGGSSREDTLPERVTENYFLFNNILYVKQYPYKLGVADFWLPENNMIVEVYGDYWHKIPKKIKADKIKNEYLQSEGYDVHILWEGEILNNSQECFLELKL